MMSRLDRARWFQLAGAGFLAPDAETLKTPLETLKETSWGEDADRLLQALAGDPLDLQRDFVRLFLSPTGAVLPPWQSARDDPPRLMGPAHESAARWFARWGVAPRAPGEPADHLGLLLNFAGFLLEQEASAEELAAFHQEHLGWVPPFCERIAAEARHPFLVHLAKLAGRLAAEPLDSAAP
jgi:TorA maturation chaperone TorD